jgi:hypothetical protein
MQDDSNVLLAITALNGGFFAVFMSLKGPYQQLYRVPILIHIIVLAAHLSGRWSWHSLPKYIEEVVLAISAIMIVTAIAMYAKRELSPEIER